MLVNLENACLNIQIDTKGGELRSICDREGVEYLWQGDARYWKDRAPNIFPYIARLTGGKYRYRGEEFSMDIHGFVKDSRLACVEKSRNALRLRLESDLSTRRMYPFDFRYDVDFFLEGQTLTVSYDIKNTGDTKMYFGVGGHPGFRVPLDREEEFGAYFLEFKRPCNPKRIGFSSDCFLDGTEEDFPLEEKRRLLLRHDLFDQDAIVLKDMDSCVELASRQGRRFVQVEYPQMPYLGIWHAPRTDAPYVCIEPWTSLPSRKGIVEDLEEQADLISLEAGVTYRNTWSIMCGKKEKD